MEELKDKGNAAFKEARYKEAINYYSDAIQLGINSDQSIDDIDLESIEQAARLRDAIRSNDCLHKCLNNRAQCYLKLGKNKKVLADANRVLLAVPDDTKALFRRSQAYKELEKYDEALKDAKRLIAIDSKNKESIDLIQMLNKLIIQKTQEQQSTKTQAKNMLELARDEKGEKKLTALNNLIVLAKEDSGCNEILGINGLSTLKQILDQDKSNEEVVLAVTRIISSLCKSSFRRAKLVYNELQSDIIASLVSHQSEQIATAGGLIVQNMIYSLTDLEKKRGTKKQINQPFDFTPEQQEYIDEIFRAIVMLIMDPKCSGHGRDNCIDLCLKFVDRANGCGWTTRFIVFGIPKLLRVAATIPELNLPNSLPLTQHTKMHVSCCLSAVYDDTYSDAEKEKYNETVNSFVKDLLERNESDDQYAKLKAVAVLSTILQGPFDVGNTTLMSNNMIQLMLEFADSDNPIEEKIAVEAVVFSASKKDRATGILAEGIDILKKLYKSKSPAIKVRALVGLCKLASCKGSDASIKLLADGSASKLEKACRNILCTAPDFDSKKWACDGLAYLTLDPEVKEILIDDSNTLKALFQLAKSEDKNTLFSIASILANITNAQPREKPSEEIKKLAEYAKHHVPEEDEKDSEKAFKIRRQKLMDAEVAPVLSFLSKHKSESCQELVASVYLVLCDIVENRGRLVAAGAGKSLIPLALNGTQVGRTRAAQALAKIAISINPQLAFPGQRCLEVVRPLIQLLHPERSALENFEALMALTNLAGVDSSVRRRIIKEEGISNIENYMFDEHEDLRRAGTECICNMSQDEDVVYLYEKPDNDRVRLLVLYCGIEDDLPLNLAASGALAQFTDQSEIICQRVLDVKSFVSVFKQCACVADINLQFRIFYILRNIAIRSKEMCSRIVESELMDIIVALTRIDIEKERQKVKDLATEIVKTALEHELIKPTMASFADKVDEDF